MELVDDRTPEQKKSHSWLVIGTDSFMSGWGKASGGKSYAAWACKEEHRERPSGELGTRQRRYE